jgi:ABC-2 type transport system ATP-binding protein
MNAIETHGLTRCFGEKTVVDHLDLTVPEGELFSLLGVNGAGKTTTIRMLCCLIKPSSGDALLLERSVVSDPQAVKRIINVSPQETAVAPNLSVMENLAFMAGIYGCRRAEAKRRAEEMVAAFRLEEFAGARAKTLSGGTQRRLSIAMALISQPRILFLDEPTLGLDVLARRELWEHIRGLKGKVTILLTTHYMEEAEALSDRIAVLSRGQLRAIGTAEELIQQTGSRHFEDAFIALAQEKEGF